jgi:pimeloyl-ACP methyl ester carboxylesterase
MNRRQVLCAAAATAASFPAMAQNPATRFSVRVLGTGPDVVLIPGLTSSSEVWDETARRLSGRRRLHLIQVLGFAGTSAGPNAQGPIIQPMVEELAAYIAGMQGGKATVIGHSMGGFAGLTLAAAHPARVERLMIVDSLPFGALLFNPAATPAMIPMLVPMRDQMLAQTQEQFLAGYAANDGFAINRLVKSPDGRKRAMAWAVTSDRRTVAHAVYDVSSRDMRPLLPEVKTPTTVIYPYDPSMGALETIERPYVSNYAGLPNKTLKRIDGGYHYIMLDQPDAFAREVDAFLA